MSHTMTNGDASSQFIDHLTSYPAVSDSISAFKSNPYGKKSIALSNTGYERFVSPFVPYAKGPYGYVAPYVHKADSLASNGLTKVDSRFPIVKEDTEKIKGTLLDYAYFPFRAVGDGKNYVFDIYGSEYKSCGGDGYVAGGKAVITTSLIVTSNILASISEFLGQKKDEGSDYASKKYGQASSYAHDRSEAAKRFASTKADQAKDVAGQARHTAEQKGTEAKQTAKEKSSS